MFHLNDVKQICWYIQTQLFRQNHILIEMIDKILYNNFVEMMFYKSSFFFS